MANLANSNIFFEHKLTPEQKLWKACSKRAQALPLTYGEMRSALEWIDLTNRDFKQVCIFAGYDPAYIYRKAKGKIRRYA